MNLIRISLLLLVVTAFSCADKESEEPWGLTGTVEGRIYQYSEFGAIEPDQGNAVVTFQSESSHKSASTDANGKFVATDIPMGTYNLLIEKPGFASRTLKSYRLIGGENPVYTSTSLVRPSTSKVTDLSSTVAQNVLNFTGKVIHNNTQPYVAIAVFLSTSPDVSPTKYAQLNSFSFGVSSGSTFNGQFYLDGRRFPSGSRVYMVAYGATNFSSYDFTTEMFVPDGVGSVPSNVFSILVP